MSVRAGANQGADSSQRAPPVRTRFHSKATCTHPDACKQAHAPRQTLAPRRLLQPCVTATAAPAAQLPSRMHAGSHMPPPSWSRCKAAGTATHPSSQASMAQITGNAEMQNIKQIMGLQHSMQGVTCLLPRVQASGCRPPCMPCRLVPDEAPSRLSEDHRRLHAHLHGCPQRGRTPPRAACAGRPPRAPWACWRAGR